MLPPSEQGLSGKFDKSLKKALREPGQIVKVAQTKNPKQGREFD